MVRLGAVCTLLWNEEKKGEGVWPLSQTLRLYVSSILKGSYGFLTKEKGNIIKKFLLFDFVKRKQKFSKKKCIFFKDFFFKMFF